MKIFSKQIFMDRLRLQRGERSQKVMAALCDMKQPMYARYESGATLPSAEQLFRLCNALDCTSDYLLGLSDEGPSEKDPSVTVGDINVHGSNNRISQVINPQKRKTRR